MQFRLALAACAALSFTLAPLHAYQPTPTDSDGDLMHDAWEEAYSLNTADAADAYLDGDDDGIRNAMEYALGGNPTLSNRTILPVMGIDRSGPYSTVTYNRRIGNMSAVAQAQAASNSKTNTWTADDYVLTNSTLDIPSGLENVTYRSRNPITNSARFSRLYVRAGSAAVQFNQTVIDGEHQHGQGIAVTDIDRDGDNDILLSMSSTDTVRLFLNGGTTNGGGDASTWATNDLAPPGTIVGMTPVVADFDNDGDLDVASTGLFDRDIGFGSPGDVLWFRNPGNPLGSWTTHTIIGSLDGPWGLAAGDITGDGAADIVAGQISPGAGVKWFRNIGSGTSWSGANTVDGTAAGVEMVIVHDVDKDGVPDIIAAANSGNEIAWYENSRTAGTTNNSPTFTKHSIVTLASPTGIMLANADADTDEELFVAAGEGIFWYDPPAVPANPWATNVIDGDFSGRRMYAADFNLDGRMDAGVNSTASEEIRRYANVGDGTWDVQTFATGFFGNNFLSGGDLNRDGRPDLISSTYDNGGFDRLDWWRNAEY